MAGFNIRPQIIITLDPAECDNLLRILEVVGKGEALDTSTKEIASMFAADIRGVMESMANRLQWIAEGEV